MKQSDIQPKTISETQKRNLLSKCNKVNIEVLYTYVLSGVITIQELVDNNIEQKRLAAIQDKIGNMPDPQESIDWDEIMHLNAEEKFSDRFLSALNNYILKWGNKSFASEHLTRVIELKSEIEQSIVEHNKEKEKFDFDKINYQNKKDIEDYLKKYPYSVNKKEIENNSWNALKKDSIEELEWYNRIFHNGEHCYESDICKKKLNLWITVKNENDIFKTQNYIQNNQDSPFWREANDLLSKQKSELISKMRREFMSFPFAELDNYLSHKIFSLEELEKLGIMTEDIYNKTTNKIPLKKPDMSQSVTKTVRNSTDVYLWGVPTTGKTCVVMGLVNNLNFRYNSVLQGGKYADTLKLFVRNGQTVDGTLTTFITSIKAEVFDKNNLRHNINLIDMSGEELAKKLANNPKNVISFKDMGMGAPELLSNKNDKIIFLVIDPTQDIINLQDTVTDTDNEGNKYTKTINYQVDQEIILNRMIDLLSDPINKKILNKIVSIHIIMTKSDMLSLDRKERAELAGAKFKSKYAGVIGKLVDLCSNGINISSYSIPHIIPFSLGKFYIGGLYEYDPNDSNLLCEVIADATPGTPEPDRWTKLSDWMDSDLI